MGKKSKKRISKAYWIWFQFSKFDNQKLNKIKRVVNNHLKGPNFSIHLTAIGPFLKLNKEEFEKIEKISKKINKFKILLIKYKLTNQFTDLLELKILLNNNFSKIPFQYKIIIFLNDHKKIFSIYQI